MSAKRLIPCLDVAGGRVQKGVQFQSMRDMGDPLGLALRYQAGGADEIVMLEIAATRDGLGPAVTLTRRLGRGLSIPLTVGGGVRTLADAARLLEAGADRVAVNSAALARPNLIGEIACQFGSQAVVVAIDVARSTALPLDRPVKARAGTAPGGWTLGAWLCAAENEGAGEFLVTSIDRDGTGEGYDQGMLAAVRAVSARPVIASGGAGRVADVVDLFARDLADAALLASRLHDRTMDLSTLRSALRTKGVEVRWDQFSPNVTESQSAIS